MTKLMTALRDESGIETLEWIAVGVLILIVAFAIYPGALPGALTQLGWKSLREASGVMDR